MYLENKELDSVLENYFDSLNENAWTKNINDYLSKTIKCNGKSIAIPENIRKELFDGILVIVDKLKSIEKSKEFKNIKKNLLDDHIIPKSQYNMITLLDNFEDELYSKGNIFYYSATFSSASISQDAYYSEIGGKSIAGLIDNLYRQLKSSKISKSAHFNNIFFGDDYYAIGITLKINKDELTESVNESVNVSNKK